MRYTKIFFLAVTLILTTVINASFATTLTSRIDVDNGYAAYLSTQHNTAGTLIGSANNWYAIQTFNTALIAGQSYYLHIYAYDQGGIAGFLGDFSLSDGGFQFANGTQSLLTNPSFWQTSLTGFGGPAATTIPVNGNNGVSPWGYRPGISNSATWIWANNANSVDSVYFSTMITPTSAPVPEPSTFLLVGAGLAGAVLIRRRKNK